MKTPLTQAIGEWQVTTIPCGEPWNARCYLVHHPASAECVLIDPGGAADLIVQIVEGTQARVRHILLTHAHHDHVGAADAVCRRFELPCRVHKADARLLRQAPMYALRFAGRQLTAPEAVDTFEGQPALDVGGHVIGVLSTPGHTAGSVCIDFGGFLFTGDTLLHQRVGRTDLPGADAAELGASVQRILDSAPPDAVMFPGHGRPWTIQDARAWWASVADSPPRLSTFEA